MAHHSQKPLTEEDKELYSSIMRQKAEDEAGLIRKMQEEAGRLDLGPTGKFPEGKLVEHDEGELRMGITHYKGKVVIAFGAPVAFIGFTPEQAVEIAHTLISHAEGARTQSQ